MRRCEYVVLLCAIEGREAEFDLWYDTRHIRDVLKIDGVVGARRLAIDWQKANWSDAPVWRSLAIYEIESDDPQAVLAAISAAADTDAMPLSPAMTKEGMLRLLTGPLP